MLDFHYPVGTPDRVDRFNDAMSSRLLYIARHHRGYATAL
jgi:hypothetical protein